MLSVFVAFVHVVAVGILIGGVSTLVSVLCSLRRKGYHGFYDALGADGGFEGVYEAEEIQSESQAA